jgi:curli biogenesis system outer membrane secretion channel CsgG
MRNVMCSCALPAGTVMLGTLLFLLPAGAQDRRIAIYDFNSQNADVNVRGKVPPTLNLGHQAAGLIMTQLVNSPTRFEVIERADIERILKEQGRKFDERFDAASAPELGRLLNVDGIVLGEVDSASATVSSSLLKLPTKSGPTIGGKTAKAKVHITARLISTQSGTIQVAQGADGDGSVSVSSAVSGVGGGVDSDEHTAMGDAVTKAMAKAVNNLSSAIIGKASLLPKVAHPGAPTSAATGPAGADKAAAAGDRGPIVNSIDGKKVYIEGGLELKLAAGDRYDVRTVTRVLTTSAGQKMEVRERVETLVIDDVQAGLSIAHVEGPGDSKAKAGDQLVKSTSLPPLLAPPPPPPAAPAPGVGVPKKKFAPAVHLFAPVMLVPRGEP